MSVRDFYASLSPRYRLFFVLLTVLCGQIAGFLWIALTIKPWFGISFSALPQVVSAASQAEVVAALRYSQAVQSLCIFLFPALWIYHYAGGLVFYCKEKSSFWSVETLVALLLLISSLPCIEVLASWNEQFSLPDAWFRMEQWIRAREAQAAVLSDLLIQADSPGALMLNLFIMALLPALGEEWMFRGILQPIFIRETGKIWKGIWLTAALFSLVHFQFLGFFPRMLLGAMLGYLFYWTRNLWISVLVHGVNNALVILGDYFQYSGFFQGNFSAGEGDSDAWRFVLTGAAFTVVWLGWFIRRQSLLRE